MDRQRLILTIFFALLISAMAGWLIYDSSTKNKTTFISGAPPQTLKEIVIPANIELSKLRPPALRPIDNSRFGGASSSASVILFGTYRCADCKELEKTVKEILPKYRGLVRYVWRDLPQKDDDKALDDAVFAMCAGIQGKFWEAHDAMMQAQELDNMTYTQIMAALKLDTEKMTRCQYDASIPAGILRDAEIAGGDGVTSTPLLFIGTEAVNQPLPAEELEKKLKLFLSS